MENAEIVRHVSQSSVELARGAKGNVTITVKVYDDDPDTAAAKAKAVLEKLEEDYPVA